MGKLYQLIVGHAEQDVRLDQYLVRHLPEEMSRVSVQRAIDAGAVMVDGRIAKAHRRLKPGEVVSAKLSKDIRPPAGDILRPEEIPIDVVYEDDQLLVVNKPPGLVTHPAPGHWSGTLVNGLLWHLQQRTTAESEVLPRAGIVHRLDKDTSGLLLVAKTEPSLRALGRQLKARTIGRRYLALVERHVGMERGTIDASIGRHPKDRKVMAVRHLGGRNAVTHFRVLARVDAQGSRLKAEGRKESEAEGCRLKAEGDGDKTLQPLASSLQPTASLEPLEPRALSLEHQMIPYTILDVALETGRTHQVRVHVAHLGHPILGDPVYGRHPATYWAGHGVTRQLLHAYEIHFTHPTTGKPVSLRAPIPEDIRRWIPTYVLSMIEA